MFSNAQAFNEEGSEVFEDALELSHICDVMVRSLELQGSDASDGEEQCALAFPPREDWSVGVRALNLNWCRGVL